MNRRSGRFFHPDSLGRTVIIIFKPKVDTTPCPREGLIVPTPITRTWAELLEDGQANIQFNEAIHILTSTKGVRLALESPISEFYSTFVRPRAKYTIYIAKHPTQSRRGSRYSGQSGPSNRQPATDTRTSEVNHAPIRVNGDPFGISRNLMEEEEEDGYTTADENIPRGNEVNIRDKVLRYISEHWSNRDMLRIQREFRKLTSRKRSRIGRLIPVTKSLLSDAFLHCR